MTSVLPSNNSNPQTSLSLPSAIGLAPTEARPEALLTSKAPDASIDDAIEVIFGDEPSYQAFTRIRGLAKPDGEVIVTITPTSTAITVIGSGFVASAEELRENSNAPAEGISMRLPTSYVTMLCGANLAPKIPFGFLLKVDRERRRVVAVRGRKRFAFPYGSIPDVEKSSIPALAITQRVDTDALRQAIVAVDVARPRRSSPPLDRIFIESGLVWAGDREKVSLHEDKRLAGLAFGLPAKLSTAFREALRHLPAASSYGVAGDWSVIGEAGVYFAWPALTGSVAPHLLEPLRRPSALTVRVGAKDFLDTLWAFSALDRSQVPSARLALRDDGGQLILQAYVQEVERHSAQSLLVTTIEHEAEIVAGSLDIESDLSASVDYVALRDFAGPDYDQTKHLDLEWITLKDHAQVRLRRVQDDCTTILTLAGNRTAATAAINTKRRRR